MELKDLNNPESLNNLTPDRIKSLVHDSVRGANLVKSAYFNLDPNLHTEQRKNILKAADADSLANIHTDYLLDNLKNSIQKIESSLKTYTMPAGILSKELYNLIILAGITPQEAVPDKLYYILNCNSYKASEQFENIRKRVFNELAYVFLTMKNSRNLDSFLKSTLRPMSAVRYSFDKNCWGIVDKKEKWQEHPGFLPVIKYDNLPKDTALLTYEDAFLLNCDNIATELKIRNVSPFKKYI